MSHAGDELKASTLWSKVRQDRTLLSDPVLREAAAKDLVIDDWLSAVNIGISLRELEMFGEANLLFERLLSMDARSAVARFEYSLSLTRADRHADALYQAGVAAKQSPEVLRFAVQYAMLLANAGDEKRAARQLDNHEPKSQAELRRLREARQFARYLGAYPRAMAEAVIREVSADPAYLGDEKVADSILCAINGQTPFSVVRLGDGEGAWLFMDNTDEGDYPDLYAGNRRNFLKDWFGSDSLEVSDEFFDFARNVNTVLETADIIGIPDRARIGHEYRLLSQRGVPSCVNILRKLGLMTGAAHVRAGLTSNNVHRHLERQGFHRTLWNLPVPFGLITSQRALPGLLVDKAGLDLRFALLTPGDSRNFWFGEDQKPMAQFPDTFESNARQIQAMDLKGVVVLVAAGFVGKRYLALIKQQGGIALDVGAVADDWARTLAHA